MKTLEAAVRKARSDFYSSEPETKRIVDAAKDYMVQVLLPYAESDSEPTKLMAAEIYTRFVCGFRDLEAAPIIPINPAITEVSYETASD